MQTGSVTLAPLPIPTRRVALRGPQIHGDSRDRPVVYVEHDELVRVQSPVAVIDCLAQLDRHAVAVDERGGDSEHVPRE